MPGQSGEKTQKTDGGIQLLADSRNRGIYSDCGTGDIVHADGVDIKKSAYIDRQVSGTQINNQLHCNRYGGKTSLHINNVLDVDGEEKVRYP